EHVRMRERRRGPGLALESGERLLVAGQLGRKDLDGDLAAELRVTRAVHLAHAAGAERRGDLVGSEACAGSKSHRADSMDLRGGILASWLQRVPRRPVPVRP